MIWPAFFSSLPPKEMASQNVAMDDEYEKKLRRRVLWKLDYTRIAGLERDTHLRGDQFNSVLAVFYASYLLVEMPSNWILKRMGANRWLPLIVCAWGIVTTLTGLVHNFGGILAIRIVLGACEGGLLPGIILYLSMIYKRHELQLRVGIFYASASLSGAFGGLLATAILKMDGIAGLSGWRYIFILEGICTVLLSLLAAALLPADLASAKFLTAEEREFAIARFNHDLPPKAPTVNSDDKNSANANDEEKQGDIQREYISSSTSINTPEEEVFEWKEVIRGATDIQTWLTGIAYFGLISSASVIDAGLDLPIRPTIITGLGYKGPEAQLHTVPPYVPAAVLTVVVAFLSDRLQWRGPFILICLPFAIVGKWTPHLSESFSPSLISSFAGYIVAITAKTNTGRYAAVFRTYQVSIAYIVTLKSLPLQVMAAGVYPSGPSILSILPNNNSGHFKKATSVALQLAIANCGGFLATFAYTPDQAPRYIRGHTIALCFLILAWILIAANVVYCLWENKARAEGRRQDNITKYQELLDSGKTRAPIGDRHPHFRFTL
ncbi:hypothetical protein D9757_000037 [Collybiopsis confluens]|uniref:Major facilitator superfamily (MFS) profile domain-containing protein n=1 Tax=Collybiopsis confluens TaxID=2823264 RepID=A0A8H5I288_9AGAR|nr:hypothetical protein D9757_000037 [Collybiopsis confluens]